MGEEGRLLCSPCVPCRQMPPLLCVSLSCCAFGHVSPLASPQVGVCICFADCQPLSPLCSGRRVLKISWETASSIALTFCLLPTFSVIPGDLSKSRTPLSSKEGKASPKVTFSQTTGTFHGDPSHYILCWSFSSLIML